MTVHDETPLAILIATSGSWMDYQPLFRYPLRHDQEIRPENSGRFFLGQLKLHSHT